MSKYKIFGSTSQELKLPQDKPLYNLDLINSQTIPPEYTFTRNSAGTYVGSDGLIKTAAVNEPRFDYDPSTGEFKGLLIEESRVNFAYPSVYMNGAGPANVWKVTPNSAISPNGTLTAANYVWTSFGGAYVESPIITNSIGIPYTGSVFIKPNDSVSSSGLQIGRADSSVTVSVAFNHKTKTISQFQSGSGANVNSSSIISLSNGWYRISVTGTFNTSHTNFALLFGARSVNGNIFAWGFQLEQNSTPSSYIPTSGSAVTRQADQLILNKPFNSLGTFFVESTSTTGTTLSADNGTSSLVMSSTGKEALYYNTNRTLRMSSDYSPTSFNSSAPQNLNRVSLGYNALTNSEYINGYLKKFMYYGSPVTEDNLRSLTGNTLDTYRSDGTIVTNGLVLHLDAGNLESYPGTGTTWTDLSGNGNNGTLVNGVGYNSANGGSLVFDGVNDYVGFNSYNFGNELTVFSFIIPSSVNNISTIFANIDGGNTTNGVKLFLNNFITNSRILTIEIGNGTSGFTLASSNHIIEYGKWQQVAFTLSKTAAVGATYLNGTSVRTGTLGVTNYNTNAVFRIGQFTDNQFPYLGRIANYLIYNRALTASEIQQNFNALRGRFGI